MIDMNKKYKTKNGFEVVLTELFDGRVYGRFLVPVSFKWWAASWSALNGACWDDDSGYDLIEVPEFEILSSNNKLIKYVTYFGQELIVPDWTKYIATNLDGKVYAYNNSMPAFISRRRWIQNVNDGKSTILTTIKYSGDWTKSLVEV
jgi:hypothetical protein